MKQGIRDSYVASSGSHPHEPAADVLVVDDDGKMRDLLVRILSHHFNMRTAENGADALVLVRESPPDLIVSDMDMPVMNGSQLCRSVKGDPALSHIPFILLTARGGQDDKISGLSEGADDYITKPFNAAELIARSKNLIKMRRQEAIVKQFNVELERKVREQVRTIQRMDQLKRYLPPQLVGQIIAGRKKVELTQERVNLVICYTDIQGFTAITDAMDLDGLSRFLNRYLTEMSAIAFKWGGTIDKFIGDAILVFFGAPEFTSDEDHALRCVKMAVEMQARVRELAGEWAAMGLEKPLVIRIGITTGPTNVGNFGCESRIDYTIIGSHVNLAARLQAACEPGGVLICESTRSLVGDRVACESMGEITVKGVPRPVQAYRVV